MPGEGWGRWDGETPGLGSGRFGVNVGGSMVSAPYHRTQTDQRTPFLFVALTRGQKVRLYDDGR